MTDALKALQPFAAAVGAAAMVWMWLELDSVLASTLITGVIVVVALLVASGFEVADRLALPLDPVRAMWLMETTRIAYFLVAVVGGALAIRVGLWLAPAEGVDAGTKKVVESVGAASIAFITAAFASIAADKSSETLGKRVRTAFQARVVTGDSPRPKVGSWLEFAAEPNDEEFALVRAVHDLNRPWETLKDRRQRAASIAKALESLDGRGKKHKRPV